MDERCQYEMSEGYCGAPIVPDSASYSGWSHVHTAEWLHWATIIPYGPQGTDSGDPTMRKIFRPCVVCGKLPDDNPAHFRFEKDGGHRFVAVPWESVREEKMSLTVPFHSDNDPRYKIESIHFRTVHGLLLWEERNIFKRLFGVGDVVGQDGNLFRVRRVALADGIEHINLEPEAVPPAAPVK